MPTLTPNFEFSKPLVNNAIDADLWGALLNTNWEDLDALLGLVGETKTADFSVTGADFNKTFYIDASGNTVTATLPSTIPFNGFSVRFKTDDVTEAVTIDGNGNNIDGSATLTINSVNDTVILVSDGTVWRVLSSVVAQSSETLAGVVEKATKAEMEGETSNKNATADNLKHHPAVPKVWCCLNGVGVIAIKDSYNVTSLTDIGTGIYRVNFTNNMANTNYAVAGCSGLATGTGDTGDFITVYNKNVAYIEIKIEDVNGNTSDQEDVSVIIFGELA